LTLFVFSAIACRAEVREVRGVVRGYNGESKGIMVRSEGLSFGYFNRSNVSEPADCFIGHH
jgi:hypothetical protein